MCGEFDSEENQRRDKDKECKNRLLLGTTENWKFNRCLINTCLGPASSQHLPCFPAPSA